MDIATCFHDKVTDTHSTLPPGYFVGMRRYENGREYTFTQADDAVAINKLVKLDIAASATAKKVTPTAAAGDSTFGVAEVAVTDEYYFWATTRGVALALVADNTTVDDPLAASGTSGVAVAAAEGGSGHYEFVFATALEANASGGALAKNIYIF